MARLHLTVIAFLAGFTAGDAAHAQWIPVSTDQPATTTPGSVDVRPMRPAKGSVAPGRVLTLTGRPTAIPTGLAAAPAREPMSTTPAPETPATPPASPDLQIRSGPLQGPTDRTATIAGARPDALVRVVPRSTPVNSAALPQAQPTTDTSATHTPIRADARPRPNATAPSSDTRTRDVRPVTAGTTTTPATAPKSTIVARSSSRPRPAPFATNPAGPPRAASPRTLHATPARASSPQTTHAAQPKPADQQRTADLQPTSDQPHN